MGLAEFGGCVGVAQGFQKGRLGSSGAGSFSAQPHSGAKIQEASLIYGVCLSLFYTGTGAR